ncbi:MAG: hypothetical protein U1C74_30015, partial [Phenylobacterium sp.]|nr:hypothetical protein [Phenylobacterium sp.]
MRQLPCVLAATAALALMAAPVQAATVIGAAKIRITNALPTWLQVGEVQAFEDLTGVNVALASNGATATGSGNFTAASSPDKAIDGLAPADYPLIYHSNGAGADEFLEITLAGPTDLSSLTIFGRADSFGNRDVYNVSIFDVGGQTLFSGQLDNSALAGGAGTLTFGSTGAVPEPATWAMMI